MVEYETFKSEKQKIYYDRTKSFLNSEKKILLNPGGMGLGKTWATIKAIGEFFDINSNKKFVFIATPTAPIKTVWGNEFNNCNLSLFYIIWFNKPSCCIKKIKDKNFDINKNCNDDCEYWSPLQANGKYKDVADDILNLLKTELSKEVIYPHTYYERQGNKYCLRPIIRLGLREDKFLIGDFYGFLNRKMFYMTINTEKEKHKDTNNGTLIIDEAHLIPERVKDFLSKTLDFTKTINKIKVELDCDNINNNLVLRNKWDKTIEKLEQLNLFIIKKTKEYEGRYNFNNFIDDFYCIDVEGSYDYYDLKDSLKQIQTKNYIESEGEELYCTKLSTFLEMWEEKVDDPIYKHYFQYKNYNKGVLRFIIDCCDTSNYLINIFRKWDKVILNSGTITDIEYYQTKLGLPFFGEKVCYEKHIESYSIKNDVVIYASGNFRSIMREKTYNNNKENLINIFNLLKGRSIIYIQNLKDSTILKKILLNTNKEIIDFCTKDDGFQTSQSEWLNLENEFNKKKEGIAIMGINSRVEGFNFLNNETGNPVDNIIIFGYPFPNTKSLSYLDQYRYYLDLIKDEKKVKRWLLYTPVFTKIHQACCRAKRNSYNKPNIILWDNMFNYNITKYMPLDLRGFLTDNFSIFYTELKRRCENENYI
jgi:Rad3-related DNA helicase